MTGIPPGVLRSILIAKGVMTERGYTRRVRVGFCSKCKAKILQGLDGDIAVLEADVDLVDDPEVDEVYILRYLGPRPELDRWRRDRPVPAFRILLSAHRCKER